MQDYIPLWCKSHFSFLEGASSPEELVDSCASLGLEALALTDRDGVYGIVEAHVRARGAGIKLIIGSEVTVEDGSTLVLLAMDRNGYANLCELITLGRRRCEKGRSEVGWREICSHAGGLLALWGGASGLLGGHADPFFVAHDLLDAFDDRLYAMLARHRCAEELRRERRLRQRADKFGMPTVAIHEVLYHKSARRDLQDALTCIRHGVKLSEAGRRIHPNAERALKSPHSFSRLFQDLLAPSGVLAKSRSVASSRWTGCVIAIHRSVCLTVERRPSGSAS